MQEAVNIECPHCGESFPLALDPSEGAADFVVDCEVCCRPICIAVRFEDGELTGLDVSPE